MTKIRLSGIVVGAVALSVVVAVATMTSPDGPRPDLPALKVTPSTNLVNKQKVQLTGTAFPKKKKVYAVECLSTANGPERLRRRPPSNVHDDLHWHDAEEVLLHGPHRKDRHGEVRRYVRYDEEERQEMCDRDRIRHPVVRRLIIRFKG